MPEIDDIVTVKLPNGEEIVGRLTEHSPDTIHLAKPMRLAPLRDAASELAAFMNDVNGAVQSGIGQTQGMMSTVNSSGLDTAHAQVSDIVANMPSSAHMISKAGEISAPLGLPPPPSLDHVFNPIVNGGLNTALTPVMGSINDMHTAVTGTISDSINAIINAAQEVLDAARMGIKEPLRRSFHPVTGSDGRFSLAILSDAPVKASDDVVRDYLDHFEKGDAL